MSNTLDVMDIKILNELQKDAKITNVDLAERVNLSPSPCLARVRRLRESGVISRYVALVDALKVGLSLNVFIQITLEKQVERVLEEFERLTELCPEVMECYLMTGDSDYMLRVVVRDIDELQSFIVNRLSKIPGVANIRSGIALKQVKYKTVLPL